MGFSGGKPKGAVLDFLHFQSLTASENGNTFLRSVKTEARSMSILEKAEFPLSSKYDPAWVRENEMGPNALWLAEALLQVMDIRPGMRVLDLGCGRAISSIFLARERAVQVWAADLWIDATENLKRIREAGVDDRVFPIHAEAHALPFAEGFFDAVVSFDSYHYFGTDVHYLEFHLLKLRKRYRIYEMAV